MTNGNRQVLRAATPQALSPTQRALLWPPRQVIRGWMASLSIEGDVAFQKICRELPDTPIVYLIWHNRLFVVSEIYRRFFFPRPLSILISASQDGAYLSHVFGGPGIEVVRGSSSRRQLQALKELTAELRAGRDLGITPDGPRGPCYEVAPGAIFLAQKYGLPCLCLGVRYDQARELPSWDRFRLPDPGSRVHVSGKLIQVDRDEDLEAARLRIRVELLQLGGDSSSGVSATETIV